MIKHFWRLTLSMFILLASQSSIAQEQVEKGQLLIQFKKGTDAQMLVRKVQVENELQIRELNVLSEIANIYQIIFTDDNQDLNKGINTFYEYSQVIAVQKNHLITQRETIPTDTLFDQQWFHKNTGQTGGTIDADIDTPDAWDITTGGLTTHDDTIVVCIIEGSGVDISHEDLVDNIWHNYGEIENDGIDNDNNGYIDDFNGWNVVSNDDAVGSGSHGTRVAGMVGATGNNVTGVSGVNHNVKMMIIKGQVASNESSVIAAYNYPLVMRKRFNDSYGEEGAFVVVTNASWGIDNGDPADAPLWCAMYDTLGAYGILNVAATTNSNSNVDLVGDLPTTCSSDYLIGVTMTNSQDIRANSGYGPLNVDIAAPGSSVLLPIPGNFYTATNGTSFASPCVAGAIALAYSSPCSEFIGFSKFDPQAAALDMKDYILDGVDVLSVLDGEVGTSGRLNIKNSIDDLIADCGTSPCTPPYYVHDTTLVDTSVSMIWDGFSTDYIVFIQEGSGPLIQLPTISNDFLTIDTLTPCTNYSILIKGICGLDTSDYSFQYDFKTDGCCDNPYLIEDYSVEDSLIISWDAVLYGTQYDIRYRKEGDVAWIATYADTASPVIFGGLDTCTAYEFQIQTTCTDSTQGFSDSYVYATKGCGACYEAVYCDISGGNTNSEWIERIKVGTQNSITGDNNGWYQSEQILVGFLPGETYGVEIEAGYTGFEFTERFSMWIDLDHNGTFDSGEKLINNVTSNVPVITTIDIPLTTPYGVTKLRVGMSALTDPEACHSDSFFGEFEDYCVYIGEHASLENKESFLSLYPNPTSQSFKIVSSDEIENVQIFDMQSKLVLELNNNPSSIEVDNWNQGVYLVKIKTSNGLQTKKLIIQ